MDLLTHICSGAAAATIVAAFAPGKPSGRLGIITAGVLGGAIPDVDVVSLWSRFDGTFGRLFGLSQPGRDIYGEKLWYSHHAFFHSLPAALLLAVLFGLIAYGLYRIRRRPLSAYFSANTAVALGFIAGFLAHLLGDLPTPASDWGGIAMFWPSKTYVGGTGKIWWWNNYDIFLLVFTCAVLNTLSVLFLKTRARRRVVTVAAVAALALAIVQVNTRHYDYDYTGNMPRYAEMEAESKAEQRRILGPRLYNTMERFDRRVPINF
ncbi:MAG: metal-dependent hydrolase [Rikenellaceae bacterium]|jgi:membrane-bound metal-dependent hydrolase YbcI (DUF457 family)|nr:metal-dependent hydrolase [Rikenellaceae bacterium]